MYFLISLSIPTVRHPDSLPLRPCCPPAFGGKAGSSHAVPMFAPAQTSVGAVSRMKQMCIAVYVLGPRLQSPSSSTRGREKGHGSRARGGVGVAALRADVIVIPTTTYPGPAQPSASSALSRRRRMHKLGKECSIESSVGKSSWALGAVNFCHRLTGHLR
jgi:hypothetical protein